ncbi:hypothetical protein Ahy_A02g005748 isoform C [Arachis hypogaea]|uniref:Uncharacterized protein n=1 Tax=Arachis hypogaea TaxID=3818 RepID=A0A445E7J8_ARAHY|nr:hypothetical protein Ahy_A02g005748 isoform C [Arachis hypogaea]
MAEKLYGGPYLSPLVNTVLDNMSSILEDDSVLYGNDSSLELLGRLQNCLYDVGPVLDDAELKQFTDKRVKKWLLDLQDALYFADDLLDELSTKAAIDATQREPGNSSSWSRLVDSYIEDSGDLEKIVRRLESVVAGKNYLRLKESAKVDIIKHTRTFLEINLNEWIAFNMENAPCILLSHLKYLRALSFKGFPLESVPDSIGELIHLRYLDLSETYIVTLPESLGNLYNLQTLKLCWCRNLKMLPVCMKDLVNLRHLDIRETRVHVMPKGMSQLKNLQFLSNYVVGKREENKMTELGALADLQQSISIAGLENVVNSSEAWMARMFDKDGICSLKLSWLPDEDENIVDSQTERDILDKLQPHTNLKELEIRGYRGTTFSDWLGSSSYRNITYVWLDGCRNCCMLPSLGQLPSLKHLTILNFESVEIVGAEFYFYQNDESCLETPFSKLESLSFSSMPCWKEWRSMEFNAFPRLRELYIRKCPVLRGDLPNNLPSLQSLKIEECDELSCCVPRAPAITSLSISGKHQVGSVVEAITNTQLTCLTSLSISGCSSHIWFPVSAIPPSLQDLTIFDCRKLEFEMDGQHHSLQELYIRSSCDSLASFSLLDSFPNLVRVDIKYCGNMESIVVSRSLSGLRYLWIKHCGSLKSVSTIWMAAPQLERLSLLGCPEIDLCAPGVPHRSLRYLFISYCEKLVSTAVFMNSQFQGLIDLWIEGECESVKCLPKEGWLPASLQSLTLEGIKSVETLECNGLAHLTSLHELSIYGCPKLENMEGEKLPASLKQLRISHTPLLGKRTHSFGPKSPTSPPFKLMTDGFGNPTTSTDDEIYRGGSVQYTLEGHSSYGKQFNIHLSKGRTEIEAADSQRRECSDIGIAIGATI